jgi:tryptophan halogenase
MDIIVVGGGSAGWIAAATLQSRLNGKGHGPANITVLASPDTPPIGVGEATIPTFRTMLKSFGVSEPAFMRACNATFKQGIRFEDWSGEGNSYLHPFHRMQGPGVRSVVPDWLASDGRMPFAETVSAQPTLISANKAPRHLTDPDFEGAVPYAYHLDANAFAQFMKDHLTAQGVVTRVAHVNDVIRDEHGNVSGLRTEGEVLTADLYIDCTGQHSLLFETPDWVSYADKLLCDAAVTFRVPSTQASPPLANFTNAKALPAGWAWDIGLRNRRGRGYVYSSRHCSAEEAEATLRNDEGLTAQDLEARHITFKSGHRAAQWQGNVVAIGLSGGFLEPLESTGLYLADFASRLLVEMFPPQPGATRMVPLAQRFNNVMAEMYDDLADFLSLHYQVSGRRDSAFWREASAREGASPRLQHLLSLWDLRPPSFADFSFRYAPFSHQSYEFILLGSGWRPDGAVQGVVGAVLSPQVADLRRRLLMALPDHSAALPINLVGALMLD